jgi:heme/copper-type cytochrome/quinol oxidase subunit 2
MKLNHWWHWVVLAGLALAVMLVPAPAGASAPAERTYRIDASRFEYNPAVLRVNPGDRVTIELVATDVVHGLAIDGYDVETTADPGKMASISFTADRRGTFHFHCTMTCGNMHPFMIGKLEVGQNTLLWRATALVGMALLVGVRKGRK